MRFGMTFLGFWLHFGRLLGGKISKKGSQKSGEQHDAFWEAILVLNGEGRRQGGGAGGLEFGKNLARILQNLEHAVPPARGRGRRI